MYETKNLLFIGLTFSSNPISILVGTIFAGVANPQDLVKMVTKLTI